LRRPWSHLDGLEFGFLDDDVASLVFDEGDDVSDSRFELLADIFGQCDPESWLYAAIGYDLSHVLPSTLNPGRSCYAVFRHNGRMVCF